VLTHEAPRPWWSWQRWAIGFVTPLLMYALWIVLVAVTAHRIAAKQAADPQPAPDSMAGYFVFFMVLVGLVLVAALVAIAGVLCSFRRLRAFGIGALTGNLLPVLLVGGYLVWTWHGLGNAVS
jgi:hypothetical protein